MSKVTDLKKAIAESEKEIENLEKKRNRSQSALLHAFLTNAKPDDTDMEYFKGYTNLIELERKNLRKLLKELEESENQ